MVYKVTVTETLDGFLDAEPEKIAESAMPREVRGRTNGSWSKRLLLEKAAVAPHLTYLPHITSFTHSRTPSSAMFLTRLSSLSTMYRF